MGQGGDFLRAGAVRVDPVAFDIGDEDVRTGEHAVAGMDAFAGLEADGDLLAADFLDCAHDGLPWDVGAWSRGGRGWASLGMGVRA